MFQLKENIESQWEAQREQKTMTLIDCLLLQIGRKRKRLGCPQLFVVLGSGSPRHSSLGEAWTGEE